MLCCVNSSYFFPPTTLEFDQQVAILAGLEDSWLNNRNFHGFNSMDSLNMDDLDNTTAAPFSKEILAGD